MLSYLSIYSLQRLMRHLNNL